MEVITKSSSKYLQLREACSDLDQDDEVLIRFLRGKLRYSLKIVSILFRFTFNWTKEKKCNNGLITFLLHFPINLSARNLNVAKAEEMLRTVSF